MLQEVHETVDAGARRLPFHHTHAVTDCGGIAVPVHGQGLFRVPFSRRDGTVEIVCPDEDEDGVDVLAAFGEQFLRLAEDPVRLVAVDAVAIGLDAQDGDQLMPIDVLALELVGVRDGVTQEGDLGAVPLAGDFRLRIPAAGGEAAKAGKQDR